MTSPLEQADDGGGLTISSMVKEFQGLKDKFKREDADSPSPFSDLEKATVLQECRVFSDSKVVTESPRKCSQLITKLLHIVTQGDAMSSSEVTEVFFGVTKLFQSSDASLRRMIYFFIKEVAETCNPDDIIIVTSSLTKDMNSKEDLFRANSIRVLAKMIDATMLGAIERYIKQAIVDRNAMVSSSALVAGTHLIRGSPDVVRRWVNEVQEALHSSSDMVQFHALSLLYEIKQHDRLAISKLVTKLTRGTISSPLATCLLIRYITTIVRDSGGNALASATGRAAYQFLELSLRHRSEAVIYEAAKALCNLPGIEERDLGPAVAVLQLFLSSPKSTLRLAAMRALSSVAIAKPSAVIKCNDDMESLIADNNRSIATFAITTLLKTGSESSVDRLMKQISSFMNEIADEFKIVVVTAIRELCLKYPLKHRVLVGFLANFLREEGGFEFKKAIVDAIIALMCVISETKESSLFHLCEFIEDCEFTALSTQILHLVGIVGPTTVAPARYIRFVYNRVILENAAVRAAAITTLAKFAARLPALQASVSVLLRRSLRDEDDEVRDRATVALRLLGENITKDAPGDGEAEGNQRPFRQDALAADSTRDLPLQPEIHLLLEPLPMSFAQLSAALKEFEVAGSREDDALALSLTTLPVVDYTRPSSQSAVPASASLSSSNDSAELYKIPELATLGRVHSSTSPIQLTESETDLQLRTRFQINCWWMHVKTAAYGAPDSPQHYDHVASVHAPILRCGATERAWLILRGSPGSTFGAPAHFLAELKFRVVEIDPATGEFEGDEEGFPEDYPLEDIEISTADFVAKADISNFRQAWDSLEKDKEVLQKYSLQFKDVEVAIDAVISCLGMQSYTPEDGTNEIDKSRIGMPHTLHLSGCFAGNLDILARAQLQVEDKLGCILKIAVRSPQLEACGSTPTPFCYSSTESQSTGVSLRLVQKITGPYPSRSGILYAPLAPKGRAYRVCLDAPFGADVTFNCTAPVSYKTLPPVCEQLGGWSTSANGTYDAVHTDCEIVVFQRVIELINPVVDVNAPAETSNTDANCKEEQVPKTTSLACFPETPQFMDIALELSVSDPTAANNITLHTLDIDENVSTTHSLLRLQKVRLRERGFIVSATLRAPSNTPISAGSWSLIAYSATSLPRPQLLHIKELDGAGTQEEGMTYRFGSMYSPNKHLRLFRDILEVPQACFPLSINLDVIHTEDLPVRFVIGESTEEINPSSTSSLERNKETSLRSASCASSTVSPRKSFLGIRRACVPCFWPKQAKHAPRDSGTERPDKSPANLNIVLEAKLDTNFIRVDDTLYSPQPYASQSLSSKQLQLSDAPFSPAQRLTGKHLEASWILTLHASAGGLLLRHNDDQERTYQVIQNEWEAREPGRGARAKDVQSKFGIGRTRSTERALTGDYALGSRFISSEIELKRERPRSALRKILIEAVRPGHEFLHDRMKSKSALLKPYAWDKKAAEAYGVHSIEYAQNSMLHKWRQCLLKGTTESLLAREQHRVKMQQKATRRSKFQKV